MQKHCLGQIDRTSRIGLTAYLHLLPSEPFRLFFPAAVLASICGVALWPLFYTGVLGYYPSVSHARVMVEGFVGGFAVGFLGTAAPRMLSVPRLRPAEIVFLFLFYSAAVVAHLGGYAAWGDLFFLATLATLAFAIVLRVCVFSAVRPPPGAIMVAGGIACAMAGAVLLMTEPLVEGSTFRSRLARLLLYEGFILLPILGVGSFLFPRFFPPSPSGGAGEERASAGIGWGAENRLARVLAGVAAAAVVGTFVVEASGYRVAGAGSRAIVAAGFLLYAVPLFRRWPPGRGTLANSLQTALICVLSGLVAGAFFPLQRIGLDHILFVSGFGLTSLTVAARVLLGHAGKLGRAGGKLVSMRWVTGLAITGAATRAVADFVPKIVVSHHVYAAVCWAAAAVIWACVFLPLVAVAEND